MIRLAVDFEHPSRVWWEQGGQALWDAINEDGEASVILDETVAKSWLEQARAIPGWDDGPEYAPHPITSQDVDPDEDII